MIYVSNIDIILAGIRILYLLFVNLTLFFSGKACKVIVYKILDYRDRLISCDQSLNSPFGSSSKAKDLNACNFFFFFFFFSLEQHIQLSYFQTQIKAKPKGLLCFQLGKKNYRQDPLI